MNPRLLVATGNCHKTAEIGSILGPAWVVLDLTALPPTPPVEETGATFEANARLKASAASRGFAGIVLADDSGLEVDALGGRPGVRSARYAGPHATDAGNRALLLRELAAADARGSLRSARFRCAIALASEGAVWAVCEGRVEGKILDAERGTGGFGYDAMFVPDGFDQTFAELPPAVKNAISHRARALAAVLPHLQSAR